MSNRRRRSPEQIIRKLAEGQKLLASGMTVEEVCRKFAIAESTWARWLNQYGGMKANDAKRLKELETENAALTKLLAEAELDKARARVHGAPPIENALTQSLRRIRTMLTQSVGERDGCRHVAYDLIGGYPVNLTVGERQRKRPKAGDVFAVRYDDLGVVFGRLVDLQPLGTKGDGFWEHARLVYVYKGVHDTAVMPPAESLVATNLLMPPMLIDKSPWSSGGIEVVGNVPLADGHVLTRCSFRSRRGPNRDVFSYLDANRQPSPVAIEPVIESRLTNVRTLDLNISKALGLPSPQLQPNPTPSITAAVKLVELEDHNVVCVTVRADNEQIAALGRRINERWPQAYMNGYNWEALIHAFVRSKNPELDADVQTDSEAGMYSANMPFSPANVGRMREFEGHIGELFADETILFSFIETTDIAWE